MIVGLKKVIYHAPINYEEEEEREDWFLTKDAYNDLTPAKMRAFWNERY